MAQPQILTLEVSVISDLQEDDMDVEGSVEPAAMCLSTDHYHLLLLRALRPLNHRIGCRFAISAKSVFHIGDLFGN